MAEQKMRNQMKDRLIFMTEGDAALGQVVWRHFNIYFIAHHNANAKFAHFAGSVRQNFYAVFQLNAKHGVWQFFNHFAGQFQ